MNTHAYNCPKDGSVVTCTGEGALLTGRCPSCGSVYEVADVSNGPGPSVVGAGHKFGGPGGVAPGVYAEAEDDAVPLDVEEEPSTADVLAALADEVVSLKSRVALLEGGPDRPITPAVTDVGGGPETQPPPPAEEAPSDAAI